MPKQSGSLTEQADLSSERLGCLESVRQGKGGRQCLGSRLDCTGTGQAFMGPSRHRLLGIHGGTRDHAELGAKGSPVQNMESHTETQKVYAIGTYSNWKNKSKSDRIKRFCQ